MSEPKDVKFAHVICDNDSVEAVCLGSDQEAQERLERLAKADFEIWHVARYESYAHYRNRHYWHVHTVPIV